MIIYLARNRANGKAYVGKTKRTLEQRWKEHVRNALVDKREMPIYAAIRKHGVESFELKVLQECSSDEEMNVAEKRWIEELGTFSRGYNATKGGDGVSGWSPSAEHRKAISEALKGEKNHNFGKKWGLKAGIERPELGQKFDGKSNPMSGKQHSAEACARISAAAQRPKVAIRVQQLDTEGKVIATYRSMSAACKVIGGKCRGIKACCDGRQQTYRGFAWKFIKD